MVEWWVNWRVSKYLNAILKRGAGLIYMKILGAVALIVFEIFEIEISKVVIWGVCDC